MKIHAEPVNNVVVVDLLADSLDAGNTREFRETITPLINTYPTVILNLEKVSFLDSSGCGSILSCLRQLNAKGGDLKVYGLQKSVRSVFELVRIHLIIDIFDTREEALRKA